MIECGSLDYACARLHARHGRRADEAAWQRIEVTRGWAPLLEQARTTSLRPWLVGIGAGSTSAEIEAALRRHWRDGVDETAAWMPPPWQPALRWCAWLPELAPLQHFARGGEASAGLRDDALWHEVCAAAPASRAAVVAAGPLAPLAAAWAAPDQVGALWRAEWQRRLPRPLRAPADDALARLQQVLLAHLATFRTAPPGAGTPLRVALRVRLAALLRAAALDPALAFIHLALCALDFERLRAELLQRRLFGRGQGA